MATKHDHIQKPKPASLSRRAVLGLAGGGALVAGTERLWREPALGAPGPSVVEPAAVRIHTDKWTVVPTWTGSAPVIDGVLDEAGWADAAQLADFQTVYTHDPVDGGPTYQVAYDTTNLYLAGTMAQAEWEDLGRIEIVLSTGEAGEVHLVAAFPVNPERTMDATWDWSAYPRESPRTDLRNFVHANHVDAAQGVCTLEVAIPLAEIDAAIPTAWEQWRINIAHIFNVNTRRMLTWFPLRTARFWDRSATSQLGMTGPLVSEGRLGTLLFDGGVLASSLPEHWELSYTGFTTKQLSFDVDSVRLTRLYDTGMQQIEVWWKHAHDTWLQLSTIDQTVDGSRVTVDFEHPALTTTGAYQIMVRASRTGRPTELLGILGFDQEDHVTAGIAALAWTPPQTDPTPVESSPPSAKVNTVLGLIPQQPGLRFVGLPEESTLAPDALYELLSDGQSMKAKRTGTVYPNSNFPESEQLTVTDRHGNEVSYPYHEDAEGKRYFLSGHLWFLQRNRAQSLLSPIANTDALGAARILFAFALAAESYVPTVDERWHNFPLNVDSGYPYSYWGGLWSYWYMRELFDMRPLLSAFRKVKLTNAFEVLSAEVGVDAEQKVIEEVFTPSAEFMFSFPKTLGNMDLTSWGGLIDLNRAVGDPDHVHRTVSWIEEYVATRYLSDGCSIEVTPTYHRQATRGLVTAISALDGYTDPEGYVSPRTGKRYDNLELSSQLPIVDRAVALYAVLAYPDGKFLPVRDTWASSVSPEEPDLAAGSLLLPSAGLGRFTRGQGADQLQLWLQFSPRYGHNHSDPLNLVLYAHGQELLPDLGYTHSKRRYFTTCALGHNTVVVDGRDSADEPAMHGGAIERFVRSGTVQVQRASQTTTFPSANDYRREVWLIPFDTATDGDPDGYVLDLFRVSGGQRHEYTLNGDANRDAEFVTDLPLTPYGERLLPPGVTWVEAETQSESGTAEGHYPGYIYVWGVQQAELADDAYHVTIATSDPDDQTERASLNIVGVLDSGAAGTDELFLGRAPSIRSTRLDGTDGDTNDQVVLHDLPKLVHRREGDDLASSFVTMLEPCPAGASERVEVVERLTPDQAPEGALAVRITHGAVVDLVLSNPQAPGETMIVGDVTLAGELGFIRLVDDVVTEMQLVGGTELTKGTVSLTGDGIVAGTVVGTSRVADGSAEDSLIVDTPVPSSMVGETVVVAHPDGTAHGFTIAAVDDSGGQPRIILDDQDPGFVVLHDGTSRQVCYPGLGWDSGEIHTFSVASVARLT